MDKPRRDLEGAAAEIEQLFADLWQVFPFSRGLRRAYRPEVDVYRTAASRDPFDHAERLVARIASEQIGTICFWNVDPKIKLLVARALGFTDVALVDVSPGPASFDEMRRVGFEAEAEEPGRELAFAAIGQPWRVRGGLQRRGVDFRTFAEPGFAKMAFNFRLDGSTLSTETRVLLTDERSRRAFRRYWFVIRPFSGLIRRAWLRAIARRAEA